MVWEADDVRRGGLCLDQVQKILDRFKQTQKRSVGTGSNLLLTLVEFTMFDSDGSAAIEIDEVRQMLYSSPPCP
jgi:hypothetical protein